MDLLPGWFWGPHGAKIQRDCYVNAKKIKGFTGHTGCGGRNGCAPVAGPFTHSLRLVTSTVNQPRSGDHAGSDANDGVGTGRSLYPVMSIE